ATGEASHTFDPSKFTRIWVSAPIINDPITVRGDETPAFKAALTQALLALTPAQLKTVDTELGVDAGPMIPAKDSFDAPVRAVATSEHVNFSSINRQRMAVSVDRKAPGGRAPGAPQPSEPVLQIRGLEKRFAGGPPVLHGVDLDVNPGELVVVLGANGS